MNARSFNTRLALVILGVITLCWLMVLTVVMTQLARNSISTWDEELKAIASQLLLTIPGYNHFENDLRSSPKLTPAAASEREPLEFQIWLNRERMIIRTPDAPDTALQPAFIDGAATTVVGGREWRIYTVTDSTGSVSVQVGAPQSDVEADMQNDAGRALLLATLVLLFTGVVIWFVVRNALKPVAALGAAMLKRKKFDMNPLPLDYLPSELHPLVGSFNHMLHRLEKAIEDERRFIDDAAHELRTPLSALQAQAEIALDADNLVDKDAALHKLLLVIKRSTRLAEQLLDLARLNAGVEATQHKPADLDRLTSYVAQEFEVLAAQNGRALYLDLQPCTILCDIDEIGILLRNLIDNALRYTPEGGHVLVRCGQRTPSAPGDVAAVFLEVSDDGPGVPESERSRIFKRFHRVDNTAIAGSGIGLSLVAGIAELHHAAIETGTGLDGRGLKIGIMFRNVTTSI